MRTPKVKSAPEAVTKQQVAQATREYNRLQRYYNRQATAQVTTLRDLLSTINQSAAESRQTQQQIIDTESQQQASNLESQRQFTLSQIMQAQEQAVQSRNQDILTQNERNLATNAQDAASRRAAFQLSELINVAQRNTRR